MYGKPFDVAIHAVQARVTIQMTREDWALYDMPGADEVATKLNLVFEQLFLEGRVHQDGWKVLAKFSEFGAADTEGYAAMDKLIQQVFEGAAG